MVEKISEYRIPLAPNQELTQDRILILLSDQRLLYVVADHFGLGQCFVEYRAKTKSSQLSLLQSVFAVDDIFRRSYHQISGIFTADQNLVHPSDLENQDLINSVNDLLLNGKKDDMMYIVDSSNKTITTSLSDTDMIDYSQKMFPGIKWRSLIVSASSYFVQHVKNLPGDQIYAYTLDGRLILGYFKDCALQFINQFLVTNKDDILYYTMLLFNQFELNPDDHPITLIGSFEDSTISQLKDYVRHVKHPESALGQDLSGMNQALRQLFQLPLFIVAKG